MKKPQMIVLLVVLILGLLIPVVYRGGVSTSTNLQLEQKITGTQSDDIKSWEKPATSSAEQTDLGEKKPASRDQVDSGSSLSSGNSGQSISPEVNSGDNSNSSSSTIVAVAVVGKNGELLFGPADISLAANNVQSSNALNILAATGLPYVMSTRYPDLVISVAAQLNEGQSGWMYKVNNEIASVAASKKPIITGDRIIWWYSKSLDSPSPEWGNLLKIKQGNKGG